jgi:DNA-directed RNA polymerase specialized sigma24 family protein
MAGRGSPPDEPPEGAAAVSSGAPSGMSNVNAGAREWALHDEYSRTDPRFEAMVRAADDALLGYARAYAWTLVGANDVEDAISTAWEKVLISADMDRGTFKPFFRTVLRNTCFDILRNRKGMSQHSSDAMPLWEPEYGGLSPDPADEIMDRIKDLQGRIIAAIAVLDLTEKQRDMLSKLLDDEESDVLDDRAAALADPKAAAAARQQRKRLRDVVDGLAGLTPDELKAASLIRRHHTVAAAAAAAPDLDVSGLYASARRKVLALFDIETQTED